MSCHGLGRLWRLHFFQHSIWIKRCCHVEWQTHKVLQSGFCVLTHTKRSLGFETAVKCLKIWEAAGHEWQRSSYKTTVFFCFFFQQVACSLIEEGFSVCLCVFVCVAGFELSVSNYQRRRLKPLAGMNSGSGSPSSLILGSRPLTATENCHCVVIHTTGCMLVNFRERMPGEAHSAVALANSVCILNVISGAEIAAGSICFDILQRR